MNKMSYNQLLAENPTLCQEMAEATIRRDDFLDYNARWLPVEVAEKVKAYTFIYSDKLSIGSVTRDLIYRNWKNITPGAVPYVRAMLHLVGDTDKYGVDDAKTIVLYFLSNAQAWRGQIAKAVKADLKKRFNLR